MSKKVSVPLIPLRDIIIFPHMVVPLFVGRAKSIKALEFAMKNGKKVFLSAQKNAKTDDPSGEDIYESGTMATVLQMLKLPDGTVKVLVEGKYRATIDSFLPSDDCFMVEAIEFDPEGSSALEADAETEALLRSVVKSFETYVKLNKRVPPEMIMSVSSITDPGRLADTITTHLTIKLEEKQTLLEFIKPMERLNHLLGLIEGEIEILEVEQRIRQRVKRQMEKTQKEYYLNEQMKAIQKELGEKDEFKNEIQEFEDKIKAAKMSKEGAKKSNQEIKKLKQMSPMSAEATVVRNYIEWMTDLPWGKLSKEKQDIEEAEKILDADHYGLKKVKERILEYLAVKTLTNTIKGPILCLVGPPGVGKTSLAKSVARATGREFVRVALGGVKDEAEIRGHRRTYIGSMPGKIIQSLKKAGTSNPVMLLDEVDKMSNDFRGDPASALLEVLDPEQNHTFNDHYLDCDYDLSKVLFITTANYLQGIPYPLLDRMELIRLSGYTEDEKYNIATKFLIEKQLKDHGIKESNLTFLKSSLKKMVREYTREAGVRNLERKIAAVCRKTAMEILKKGKDTSITVTNKLLEKYLGSPVYRFGMAEGSDEIGVATGLAWTEAGGDLLSIEVILLPGKGRLSVTGKLGDVMQESTQAAMAYIRSRASELGLNTDFYQRLDIHMHFPEGATPKDGPSAGIAIATAITSALIKKPILKTVAMTGEITLRGKVLPIGGLKEKMLAAHRGGITKVLIPKENEKDLKDIPKVVLKAITVIPVEHVDEVLVHAFGAKNKGEVFSSKKVDYDITGQQKGGTGDGKSDTVVRH